MQCSRGALSTLQSHDQWSLIIDHHKVRDKLRPAEMKYESLEKTKPKTQFGLKSVSLSTLTLALALLFTLWIPTSRISQWISQWTSQRSLRGIFSGSLGGPLQVDLSLDQLELNTLFFHV